MNSPQFVRKYFVTLPMLRIHQERYTTFSFDKSPANLSFSLSHLFCLSIHVQFFVSFRFYSSWNFSILFSAQFSFANDLELLYSFENCLPFSFLLYGGFRTYLLIVFQSKVISFLTRLPILSFFVSLSKLK